MSRVIVVKAIHDPEANVWYTDSPDVYGLRIQAATLEALVERIPLAIHDLLEDNEQRDVDVPIEIIAHASTRLRAA